MNYLQPQLSIILVIYHWFSIFLLLWYHHPLASSCRRQHSFCWWCSFNAAERFFFFLYICRRRMVPASFMIPYISCTGFERSVFATKCPLLPSFNRRSSVHHTSFKSRSKLEHKNKLSLKTSSFLKHENCSSPKWLPWEMYYYTYHRCWNYADIVFSIPSTRFS